MGDLAGALFAEMERDAALRCPCHLLAGDYDTMDACLADVTSWVHSLRCLEKGLGAIQSEALRASLTCMLEERRTSNACLEHASCDDQATLCYAEQLGCATPDPALLTGLSRACPGYVDPAP